MDNIQNFGESLTSDFRCHILTPVPIDPKHLHLGDERTVIYRIIIIHTSNMVLANNQAIHMESPADGIIRFPPNRYKVGWRCLSNHLCIQHAAF